MNHDNIVTTINELDEKVISIRSEISKNVEIAGSRSGGGEKITPERGSRSMEAMDKIRELTLELADVHDDLGRAWRQKGDEGNAKYYFDKAKAERAKMR